MKIKKNGPKGNSRQLAYLVCVLAIVVLVIAVLAWPYLFSKAPSVVNSGPSAVKTPPAPAFSGFFLYANSSDGVFEYYIYSGNGTTLRLRIARDIDNKSADTLVKNDALAMRALYDEALNPYPDTVSGKIDYAPEFLPTYGADGNFSYLEAFLTSRMTYGAFTHDTAPYRGVISWEYCPALQQLRRLEVIMDKPVFDSTWAVGYAKTNICN